MDTRRILQIVLALIVVLVVGLGAVTIYQLTREAETVVIKRVARAAAEQVEAAVAADHSGQDAVVGGFDELVDQLCGGGVADAAALLAGGQGEADE